MTSPFVKNDPCHLPIHSIINLYVYLWKYSKKNQMKYTSLFSHLWKLHLWFLFDRPFVVTPLQVNRLCAVFEILLKHSDLVMQKALCANQWKKGNTKDVQKQIRQSSRIYYPTDLKSSISFPLQPFSLNICTIMCVKHILLDMYRENSLKEQCYFNEK